MSNDLSWPPVYIVTKKSNAKHVKIKTSLQKGLEIVTPKRFNLKHLPPILETHKEWILKRLQIDSEKRLSANILPVEIHFFCCQQIWKISYVAGINTNVLLISKPNNELTLLGNIADIELCRNKLKVWLKKIARKILPELLTAISVETTLAFSSVQVRSQVSRWGSCNSQKSISLNYQLLLLPHVLVRHVLLHELCHTVHLNHSKRFWNLLKSFDPDWKNNSRESRLAQQLLPAWLV
jgi:predicted metal-dependent hydrolase